MKRRDFIKSSVILSTSAVAISNTQASVDCNPSKSSTLSVSKDKLTIALISDLHIDNKELLSEFSYSLNNIKTKHNITNIIIPGDLAENIEYLEKTLDITNKIFNNENDNALFILGNHDVRGQNKKIWTTSPKQNNPYYHSVVERFKSKNRNIKHQEKHACFDLWIEEHHFIALSTDRGLKDQAYYDDTTLNWFTQKMAETVKGKRFVIVHQSLNDTHWRANLYGGFGDQDGKIKEILSQYPDTIVLSGHIHNGFGVLEVMQKEFGTLIEVPSFNKTENGLLEKGYGFIMRFYEESFVLEAWNFFKNKHYPEFDIQIPFSAVNKILDEGSHDLASSIVSSIYPWQEVAKQVEDTDDIIDGPDKFGIRKIWPKYKWERYS